MSTIIASPSKVPIPREIVRFVYVNRNRAPVQALYATGRERHIDIPVANSMPKGKGHRKEVIFFHPGCSLTDKELMREYTCRRLKPADPYTLAAVNEAEPAFADDFPNGTHWQDIGKNWCRATFSSLPDPRRLDVRRFEYGWDHYWDKHWWFAGFRK